MATYLVRIIKEMEMEVDDCATAAVAEEIAREQFEDRVVETVYVDELE